MITPSMLTRAETRSPAPSNRDHSRKRTAKIDRQRRRRTGRGGNRAGKHIPHTR